MLPTEDLFVNVYVLIDDAIASGAIAIPPRPGPAPACSDAEAFAAEQAARGTAVLVPPTRQERRRMPPIPQKVIA
jgi:hypothetical protein